MVGEIPDQSRSQEHIGVHVDHVDLGQIDFYILDSEVPEPPSQRNGANWFNTSRWPLRIDTNGSHYLLILGG